MFFLLGHIFRRVLLITYIANNLSIFYKIFIHINIFNWIEKTLICLNLTLSFFKQVTGVINYELKFLNQVLKVLKFLNLRTKFINQGSKCYNSLSHGLSSSKQSHTIFFSSSKPTRVQY